MYVTLKLITHKRGELNKFLSKFYNTNLNIDENLIWQKNYSNPIEISDMIGVYTDNIENFDINMWINLDKDVFIKITSSNADKIIRYLFERYPY